MYLLSIIIALFFALNIGASGTAASMAAAYGGGAIKKRWIAVTLVGIAAFFGAITGGTEVVKTLSEGIISEHLLTIEITIIIIASACLTLFVANLLAIPLSTSEVTVGSIIGVGISYNALYIDKVLLIMSVWIILPFLAFTIAFILGKVNNIIEKKLSRFSNTKKVNKILSLLLIVTGMFEAFSAGMNNVANAVGPLVGAGLLNINTAIIFGGLFVAIGAFTLGGRVLETNGKKITKLSLLQGSMVSLTSGSLVIIASLFGLPVPLTQATTMAILGIGVSKNNNISLLRSDIVLRIMKIWIVSPASSLIVAYTVVQTVIKGNIYSLVVVISTLIATMGYISFRKPVYKEIEKLK